MRALELLGHHDHPQHMRSSDNSPMNVVVDKIHAVKNGHAKGVVVYGYMSGCPHCIRYDGVWSEACNNCPKGVFTYKVMMEDFYGKDSKVGTPPRSFPTIYSYTRTPEGTVVRKDHSQKRDDIQMIMSEIANNGGATILGDDGEEEVIEDEESPYRAISTPTRFPPKRQRKTRRRNKSSDEDPKKKSKRRKPKKRKSKRRKPKKKSK